MASALWFQGAIFSTTVSFLSNAAFWPSAANRDSHLFISRLRWYKSSVDTASRGWGGTLPEASTGAPETYLSAGCKRLYQHDTALLLATPVNNHEVLRRLKSAWFVWALAAEIRSSRPAITTRLFIISSLGTHLALSHGQAQGSSRAITGAFSSMMSARGKRYACGSNSAGRHGADSSLGSSCRRM